MTDPNKSLEEYFVKKIAGLAAEDFFNEIVLVFQKNGRDMGLYKTFDAMRIILEIYKHYDFCNEYLKIVSKNPLDTDVLVHLLNICSTSKEHLPFWEEFVDISTKFFIKTQGEEEGLKLLRVIL